MPQNAAIPLVFYTLIGSALLFPLPRSHSPPQIARFARSLGQVVRVPQQPQPYRRGGYLPPARLRCLSDWLDAPGGGSAVDNAHCASGPRQRPLVEAAMVAKSRLYRRAQRPPLCKGPTRERCQRRKKRPQRRHTGRCGHRPLRGYGGRYVYQKRVEIAAMRTRDARPYDESGCPGRNVGADAHIGPNPPQAGLIVAGAQVAQVSGRPCRPPLRCRLFTTHYSLFTIHFSTPPSRLRRATSPKALRALGEALPCVRRVRSGIAAMRMRDARPYGENGCPGRNVGADAYIGPKREAASRGGCGGCERPFVPPP